MNDKRLRQLHLDIDARVGRIRDNRADWPCGKGCDNCCRHLADIPRLTAEEWILLGEGLARLTPQRREEITGNAVALARQPSPPYVCPLLDRQSGACPVYEQRPVACRSYGFYVQRDKGLYCGEIAARVDGGTLDDVVWGNHDAIDRQLATLGEARSLSAWLAPPPAATAP